MEDRDHIPESVKRQLRKEVGYGCPVCRSPFLTWHHFDPPYHVKAHNDPEGMIALCAEHHKEADNGNWSIERLRGLKATMRSAEDVKGSFPSWSQASFLVRLGGLYVGGSQSVLEIGGQPIIRLSKNEEDLLALSFSLYAPDGTLLAMMEDNAFELYPRHPHLYDLVATVGKRQVGVWFAEGQVGLALLFDRITIDELTEFLEEDRKRSEQRERKVVEESLATWPDKMRREILGSISRPHALPFDLSHLPEDLQEAIRSGDPVGTGVKRWVNRNCFDSEGKLPFFNFRNMVLYYHNQRITLRNGLWTGGTMPLMDYCAMLDNGRGAINLPCLCPLCTGTCSGPQS